MGYSDETLVDMYKNGDKDAIEELFERYKNLVRKKAKAMYLAGGDSDDLIQEGMIGLYKAVRDYTKEREASFATFASMCINRQIMTAVEASNRLIKIFRLILMYHLICRLTRMRIMMLNL